MNTSRSFSASLTTTLTALALLAGTVRIAHAEEPAPAPPPPSVATVEVRSPAQGVVMGYVGGTERFELRFRWPSAAAPCSPEASP